MILNSSFSIIDFGVSLPAPIMVGYSHSIACVTAFDINCSLGRDIQLVDLPVGLKVFAEQVVTDIALDLCIPVYGFDR